jgi:hypothetical protein
MFNRTYTVNQSLRFYDIPAESPEQAVRFVQEDLRDGNLWDHQVDVTSASAQEEGHEHNSRNKTRGETMS